MARAVPIWLRFLFPCVLISIGTAHAFDLPLPYAAESAFVLPPQAAVVGTAPAPGFPQPNAAESPTIIEKPQHFAVGSSFDADSIGNRNVYVDGTIAPFSGIYESGARLRLTGTASWYKFVTTEDPRTLGTGHYLEGGLLAGYGLSVPRFSIAWLVGPAFGEIVNQGVITDRWGAKAAIEMYATPTDLTMASGWVSYSTTTNNLQAQIKAGLKIFGDVYFGPEAKFSWQQILPWQIALSTITPLSPQITPLSPQTNISTLRVGAHVSALNIGPVAIGVSGGWAHDRQLGSGYYGNVNFYLPF